MRLLMAAGLVLFLGCAPAGPETKPVEQRAQETTDFTKLAQEKYAAHDYDGAILNAKRGLIDNPNDAQAFLILGFCHLSKDNIDEALDGFSNALRCDPKLTRAQFWRGYTLFLYRGRLEEALADFHRVLEIDPDYVDVYLWRGALYRQLKNLSLAESDLEKAATSKLSRTDWQRTASQWLSEVHAYPK